MFDWQPIEKLSVVSDHLKEKMGWLAFRSQTAGTVVAAKWGAHSTMWVDHHGRPVHLERVHQFKVLD